MLFHVYDEPVPEGYYSVEPFDLYRKILDADWLLYILLPLSLVLAIVLVGHVTKDGTSAGPRGLEHMVDTVLAVDAGQLDLPTARAKITEGLKEIATKRAAEAAKSPKLAAN